ncbi:hypothetical protein STRDD11_01457 [Streptococcus sp. DD11]|nr:hypothetical protein STRDD11_01457 [Streptococcus sp. DD11]
MGRPCGLMLFGQHEQPSLAPAVRRHLRKGRAFKIKETENEPG